MVRSLREAGSGVLRGGRRIVRASGVDILRTSGEHRWSLRLHRIRLPAEIGRRSLTASASFTVPLDKAIVDCGFSYRADGWHPYVQTLYEVLEDPGRAYVDTTLGHLHRAFQPATMQEVLLEDVVEPVPPLHAWPPRAFLLRNLWNMNPWLVRAALEDLSGSTPRSWLYWGPKSVEDGEADLRRLVRAFRMIEAEGFRHDDGVAPIRGTFMAAGDDYRFVVDCGNHRLAALRVLGVEEFRARLNPRLAAVVHADQLHRWTTHSGGIYPPATAQQLFWKLFTETGRTKAANLGLLPGEAAASVAR